MAVQPVPRRLIRKALGAWEEANKIQGAEIKLLTSAMAYAYVRNVTVKNTQRREEFSVYWLN